ncbi:hypothetical protein [Dickeya sp. NCPPB 3274]|uniref:hypothetical protein n=1 Tax=Dickeya sp. NCPPB 3274 TaxID=568766 RepID=UPI0005B3B311|nr:hypothetical protein [Dickeya sp. NCPPB 3274]
MEEKIFFARGSGRVRKMLTVFTDGQRYRLHYLVLARTNPSSVERRSGKKEVRVEELNEIYEVNGLDEINANDTPLPKLTRQFLKKMGGK